MKTSKSSTAACRCISRTPGVVVGRVQLLARPDPRHADPHPAVERLHVERVADLLGDVVEVELGAVALGHRDVARVLRRELVRDQPGVRHLDPEPHHRAVGRVLLHRLERERVVQEVDLVHQRELLQPLARHLVPPGEPVDDQRVARPVAEVERLVDDPLGRELVGLAAPADRPEPGEQGLEGPRPVLLGREEQPDQVLACRAAESKRPKRPASGGSPRRATRGAGGRLPRACAVGCRGSSRRRTARSWGRPPRPRRRARPASGP